MEFSQLHNHGRTVLIGAGSMAASYVKVLHSLNIDFSVICRSEKSANSFSKLNNVACEHGGLDKYLASSDIPSFAIVCVGIQDLFLVTKMLISRGVKHILIEKPGVLFQKQLDELMYLQRIHNASVFIGYNRRFYNSVLALKKLSKEDGGICSLNFDFTERSDQINNLTKGTNVKERWFLSNSSHIVDLVFNLIGLPEKFVPFHAGSGRLSWHPINSLFVGAGFSNKGIHFSYRSDWDSAGRWQICAYTKNYKFELCPLEKLYITRRNEVVRTEYFFDNTDDEEFKPGLLKQIQVFFSKKNISEICSLNELSLQYGIFKQIAGYEN